MNTKTMIRKAEVARKQVRRFGAGQALSAPGVLELRAGALARLRSTAIKGEVNAEAVLAKAAVARTQVHKG